MSGAGYRDGDEAGEGHGLYTKILESDYLNH